MTIAWSFSSKKENYFLLIYFSVEHKSNITINKTQDKTYLVRIPLPDVLQNIWITGDENYFLLTYFSVVHKSNITVNKTQDNTYLVRIPLQDVLTNESLCCFFSTKSSILVSSWQCILSKTFKTFAVIILIIIVIISEISEQLFSKYFDPTICPEVIDWELKKNWFFSFIKSFFNKEWFCGS